MPKNSLYPEMKATPRNRLAGLLADALTGVRDFADQVKVPESVPLVGGQGLGSMFLMKAPEEINELSYGNLPIQINPYAGRTANFVPEMKRGRGAQVFDALSLLSLPGAKTVAGGLLGNITPGVDAAATVFHGSPHKFDRFDASKIGTGEGAQMYGHGLYFAQDPSVANYYADALATNHRDAINKIIKALPAKPSPDDVFFELQRHPALQQFTNSSQVKNDIISAKLGQESGGTVSSEAMRAYKRLDGLLPPPEKSFYAVDLPDNAIAKMLDYDKPLSQQAPEVQAALNRLVEPPHTSLPSGYKVQEIPALSEALGSPQFRPFVPGGDPMTMQTFGGSDAATNYALNQLNEFRAKPTDLGRSLYNSISRNAADASAALRQAGIPGIRYLDGGSRSAGQGSSNYVVFPGNEGLLTILERNGQPLK